MDMPLEPLQGRVRVMAINTSYQLAPWADALYACDGKWWRWHKGVPQFKGLKIAHDAEAAREYRLHRIDVRTKDDPACDALVFDRPGLVARGRCSAHQALNLLPQFGVRTILMLGIDCRAQRWHGTHPNRRPSDPAELAIWRQKLDALAPAFAQRGITVINLSRDSALSAYRKMGFAQAVALCDEPAGNAA